MIDGLDHLAIACDPQRSDKVRLEAWIRYESAAWATGHLDRGLPADALPMWTSYCFGLRDRIFALLEAHNDFRITRKALPASTAGLL